MRGPHFARSLSPQIGQLLIFKGTLINWERDVMLSKHRDLIAPVQG